MGDGTLFNFGLQAGDLTGFGDVDRRRIGDGDDERPKENVQGDVARRTGDGALPNLGLLAGDKASASSWLLGGIRAGGTDALRPRNPTQNDETSECFGVVQRGEFGIECGELGTSVSELAAALRKCELENELVSVSDEADPDARHDGTSRFRMLRPLSSSASLSDFSSGTTSAKTIDADDVRGLSCERLSGDASDENALSVEVVIMMVVGVV